MYEEKIYTEGNEFLVLGDLFHQCIDKASKGEDYSTVINDYEAKVKVGALSTESGLLESVVQEYNKVVYSAVLCIARHDD